jgi:putative copper export protein
VLSITVDDLRLFLHVLAATVWVGGQLTLAGLVPVLRRAGADVPAKVARQFNRIAWPAFGVLIITGIWNISAVHSEISHDSDYRATLWAKLTFVVLSGLAAYLHTRASTKKSNAIWGAATALFALAALFMGIVLGDH